jgi:formamidopyrimidine-DNA glycosylase
VSIEGPEARILAEQLHEEVHGHRIVACDIDDVAGLQPTGFVNDDLADFDRLVGGTITEVRARGNTIRVSIDNGTNLVIGPEYGGRVLLHADGDDLPARTHLVLWIDDDRRVSVRLTGMGLLRCDTDEELSGNYLFQRDFSPRPDPTEAPVADFEDLIAGRGRALKSVLVGKDAVVVGTSNAAFQDILFRARLHPQRKAAELTGEESTRLGSALQEVIKDRLSMGGKQGFVDLYGAPGMYEPLMGPNRKNTSCDVCGAGIEALAVGGGRVYFCPGCQQ